MKTCCSKSPVPDFCNLPKELPDFKDPAWQQAYKDELYAIAHWWKAQTPEVREVIVAIRVGGGFDGEWGNGPDKNGCTTNDLLAYYNETRVSFIYFWEELRTKITEAASVASARSQTSDGKRLPFIVESWASEAGRTLFPQVGWKTNFLEPHGVPIYTPRTVAGENLERDIAHYRLYYPSHFNGLEPGHVVGLGTPAPTGAMAASGYWLSLVGLKAQPNFIDLQRFYFQNTFAYLSTYNRFPKFDHFMQAHLNHHCDRVTDGLIAFREQRPAFRKEQPASPDNFGGLTMNYGDLDFCLYSPRIPGLVFEPVPNSFFADKPASWQHYTMAAYGGGWLRDHHARKLISLYAYIDIDEGITRQPFKKYEIRVIYYDGEPGETDRFSIDYGSRSGEEKSLMVRKGGTREFKEAVFVVDDLRTDNPFTEASADLRLNNQGDGPDIFHSVMVRAILEGQDLPPIPPQGFSVTLGN